MSRPEWTEYFLEVADAVSSRAACTRRRVGAVVVDPLTKRIIATGYNGAPAGMPHCGEGGCPRGELNTVPAYSDYDVPGSAGFCTAVHAEANALLHAVRDVRGAVVYVTEEPCPGCWKLLAAAEIDLTVWPGGSNFPDAALEQLMKKEN